MADLEMMPEAIAEEAGTQMADLKADIAEVSAQAAAIDLAPAVDIEPAKEERKRTLSLSSLLKNRDRSPQWPIRSILLTAMQFLAMERALSARYQTLLTELSRV